MNRRRERLTTGRVFGLLALASLIALSPLQPPPAAAASFDSSNLISDGVFTNLNAMSKDDIQIFLQVRGSFLKDFSENGRSAAQIIYDAAHGKNEASGTINGIAVTEATGTVNPQVILATLQKEQSLVTMTSQNDAALRAAMGYACPDSGGCSASYAGFTKQVENGAWQLRYNYERAQGRDFADYQVGQSFCFADVNGTNCGTFGNRATASLYRYTPHVYNGNYNFTQFMANWFDNPGFAATWGGQSSNPTLSNGQSTTFTVAYKNTGSFTWTRGTVNLGLVNESFRPVTGSLLANGWLAADRPAGLNQASVAPGEVGTFTFQVTNPALAAGTHRLDVGLVADGLQWFPSSTHSFWEVTVNPAYAATWGGQSGNLTLANGQTQTLMIAYKNTGSQTWQRGTVNLGLVDSDFRFKTSSSLASSWLAADRPARLDQASVAPGEVGTFTFQVTNPALAAGTHQLHVGLVADGVTWFPTSTHAYWDVTVNPPYAATWGGQSSNPTLSNGQSTTLTIAYKNTGSFIWTRGIVNLGLVDRDFRFATSSPLASSWLAADRPARLNEASVAPGEVGTFTFTVVNPGLSAGTHRLDVGLVADGVTWFPTSTHAFWTVTAQ